MKGTRFYSINQIGWMLYKKKNISVATYNYVTKGGGCESFMHQYCYNYNKAFIQVSIDQVLMSKLTIVTDYGMHYMKLTTLCSNI